MEALLWYVVLAYIILSNKLCHDRKKQSHFYLLPIVMWCCNTALRSCIICLWLIHCRVWCCCSNTPSFLSWYISPAIFFKVGATKISNNVLIKFSDIIYIMYKEQPVVVTSPSLSSAQLVTASVFICHYLLYRFVNYNMLLL